MKQLTINITDLVSHQCAYHELMKQVEPVLFRELLRHTAGNKSQAAKIAGVHRSTFTKKLKQYGIELELQVKSSQGGQL